MRDKKMKARTGGEKRVDTCDHGLSRSSLRVSLPRVWLESESDESFLGEPRPPVAINIPFLV